MERWLESYAESGFRRSADLAHDLKTPLNVAVLNLELLRMRLARHSDEDPDEKISGYLRGLETELRRMARIFDAFFVHSSPPRDGSSPRPVDVASILRQSLTRAGYAVPGAGLAASLVTHEARWVEMSRLLAESISKIFDPASVVLKEEVSDGMYRFTMSGRPTLPEGDLGKLFKFYYTDPSGNPDLSLATARLIAETYGSTLDVREEEDRATLELTFALGDR